MLILLPPSEGKADPPSGARRTRPLDLDRLSSPGLTPARERVLDALTGLCADQDPAVAARALGLTAGQHPELARNAVLRSAPARPAGEVYTGVLYQALDAGTLAAPARRQLDRQVLIFSALWGVLRRTDRVPAYRCSMAARLPGLGALAGHWRRVLDPALTAAAGRGLILDLRSGPYASAWRPAAGSDLARRTVAVRVLHERLVDGRPERSVVSHVNKATKGRLVRALVTAEARPTTVAGLVSVLRDLTFTVEQRTDQHGCAHLDLVVDRL